MILLQKQPEMVKTLDEKGYIDINESWNNGCGDELPNYIRIDIPENAKTIIKKRFLKDNFQKVTEIMNWCGKVYKMNKVIYGIKQGPRIQYKSVKRNLNKMGLKEIPQGPCTFTVQNQEEKLIVLVHVDDFVCILHTKNINNPNNLFERFYQIMSKKCLISKKKVINILSEHIDYDYENHILQ